MAEIRSVDIPSPRVEGEEKVGGQALYAVDVVLPNLLWVKVPRSPIAHGRSSGSISPRRKDCLR